MKVLVPHTESRNGIVQSDNVLWATSKCCGCILQYEHPNMQCGGCLSVQVGIRPVGYPHPEQIRPDHRVSPKHTVKENDDTLSWWLSMWLGTDVEVDVTW